MATDAAIDIRREEPRDVPAIREVNRLAFGQDQEANIVDALRSNGGVTLSLVACLDGEVVGHILYSPATLNEIEGAGLAPMAVHPDYQRQGIGGRLIAHGSAILRDSGCPFVIVLGHHAYYPRFGFVPACGLGISCEWDVPDEAFMLLVLDETRMRGASGQARYRNEFSSVS